MKKIIYTIVIATVTFIQSAAAQNNPHTLVQEIEQTVRKSIQQIPSIEVNLENDNQSTVINAVSVGLQSNTFVAINTAIRESIQKLNISSNEIVVVNAVAMALNNNITASLNTVLSSSEEDEMAGVLLEAAI